MRKSITLLVAAAWCLTGTAQIIHEVTLLDLHPYGEDYAPVFLDSGFVMCSVRENACGSTCRRLARCSLTRPGTSAVLSPGRL